MGDSVFITGTSTGLGRGLAELYLQRGYSVYGLSRRPANIDAEHFHEVRADLGDLDTIPAALDELLGDSAMSLAILCAGVLGQFKTMPDITLAELRQAMDINVWANKGILDWFAARQPPQQIVLISSGASIKGNKGWGGYALSKAALNMLAQLYAQDLPQSHLTALAPGLVHTAMQDHISTAVDSAEFPSVERLQQARGTDAMPKPAAAACLIADALPGLRAQLPSGGFADIRKL